MTSPEDNKDNPAMQKVGRVMAKLKRQFERPENEGGKNV